MSNDSRIRQPKYRHYRPKNLGVVRVCGRDIYLGNYNSPQSLELYHRVIAAWLKKGRRPLTLEEALNGENDSCANKSIPQTTGVELTINELVLRYWEEFVAVRYSKNGKPTDRQYHFRLAFRHLCELCGSTPANDFGPKRLKEVRDYIISQSAEKRGGLNRNYVNDHVGIIKKMFRWAVAEEVVGIETFQSLQTLENIHAATDDRVKESKKIEPAPIADVYAVIPYVSRQIGAMIELQLFTGMRPDEVTIIRPTDIDRSENIWLYRPGEHKLQYKGLEKTVCLGPKAQQVLEPWLDREPNQFCFSPIEVMAQRRKDQNVKPAGISNSRPPREHYDDESYCQAVERGCKRAGVPKWTPGQLRHNAATEIRREFGLEAARLILGHTTVATTEIYAAKDIRNAAKVAMKIG